MNALSSALSAYRRYRAARARSKTYRTFRYLVASGGLAYLFLLAFPQVLFAFEIVHDNFTVFSRQPLDPKIHAILDSVEARLSASGIDDKTLKPRIFIADSHGLYAAISMYVGRNSFAKAYAALPTSNVFVNTSDVAHDRVFRNAGMGRERSLSGVIAHEVTHLLVRKKLGYVRNLMLPAWKQEGYAEYVAGGTLLDATTGARMWKDSPSDDSGYRYFKYYMLVKYLIDVKKLSPADVFAQDFDVSSLEREVLNSLEQADATVRLEPSAFATLPLEVRHELEKRDCVVPQSYSNSAPHNVVRGRFTSGTQADIAVLCSKARSSSILVFRSGSTTAVAELANRPDADFLQVVTAGGGVGYSRALGIADAKYIQEHNQRYGGSAPPPLDHDGINDIFVGKASVVWYWSGGRWLQLPGAD